MRRHAFKVRRRLWALLLAALLFAALTAALAEMEIALGGAEPDVAMEVPDLEVEALPELSLSDGLALDGDIGLDDAAALTLEETLADAPVADAVEANEGEGQEEIVLKERKVEDAHGEVVDTYQYFDYGWNEESGSYRYRYRVLDSSSVRIIGYEFFSEDSVVSIPATAGPYRVTEIGDGLIAGYSNKIRIVIIPDTVKAIGDGAFADLRGLKSVTIPDSVETIGRGAFEGCDYLTSVSIPGSIKALGESTFSGCTALGSVTLNSGLETIGKWCFAQCAVSEIAIPGSVKTLGTGAFSQCSNLQSVSLPEGLVSIGESAFAGCKSLGSVTFPASLTGIGESAFYDCDSLTSVEVPMSVVDMGQEAFGNCDNLIELTIDPKLFHSAGAWKVSRVVIPNGVTAIPDEAFMDWRKIASVTIPNTVTRIGDRAFRYCEGLTDIAIPDSVTEIGKQAFCECNGLSVVNVPLSVTSMGEDAFTNCNSLKTITIEPSLFKQANPWSVTKVIIPYGITEIPDWAFSVEAENHGYNFTTVSIPKTVTKIGKNAFNSCSYLTSVTIPANVTSIGAGAFQDCGALKKVTLPKSLKTIGEGAFTQCQALTAISIPASVTSIGKNAFAICSGLKKITLAEGLKTIGARAFTGTAVKTLSIPASVTDIKQGAFQYCESLTKLTLRKGLKTIGSEAFRDCHRLTTVTVPSTVKSVGKYAFYNCPELKKFAITKNTKVGKDFVSYSSNLVIKTSYKSPAEVFAREKHIKVQYTDAPKKVALNKTGTVKLELGKTLKLKATLSPKGCVPFVSWKSSNEQVARVSEKGVVMANKKGAATISVYDANGKKRASVKVRVIAPKPKSVEIAGPESMSMPVGATLNLQARVEPGDAQTKLTWTSSKPTVASVDKKGYVKALKAGKTVITVKTSNGKKDTIEIIVLAPTQTPPPIQQASNQN